MGSRISASRKDNKESRCSQPHGDLRKICRIYSGLKGTRQSVATSVCFVGAGSVSASAACPALLARSSVLRRCWYVSPFGSSCAVDAQGLLVQVLARSRRLRSGLCLRGMSSGLLRPRPAPASTCCACSPTLHVARMTTLPLCLVFAVFNWHAPRYVLHLRLSSSRAADVDADSPARLCRACSTSP